MSTDSYSKREMINAVLGKHYNQTCLLCALEVLGLISSHRMDAGDRDKLKKAVKLLSELEDSCFWEISPYYKELTSNKKEEA